MIEKIKKEILNKYRSEIDDVDIQLLSLLEKRLEICKQIGILKKDNNIPVVQINRFNELLKNLKMHSKLDPKFIFNIWDLIHKESIKIQKNLDNNNFKIIQVFNDNKNYDWKKPTDVLKFLNNKNINEIYSCQMAGTYSSFHIGILKINSNFEKDVLDFFGNKNCQEYDQNKLNKISNYNLSIGKKQFIENYKICYEKFRN